MPQFRPISDLRNTKEISKLCHETQEPVFITKNGYDDLVIMSIEAYENLIDASQIDTAIAKAEKEFADDGALTDAREALTALRRKHFD